MLLLRFDGVRAPAWKYVAGYIQFAITVENHNFTFAFPRMTNPKEFGVVLGTGDTVENYARRTKAFVLKEFIESRPWAFRELAESGLAKADKDILFLLKTATSFRQMSFVFMILQYILLGFAVFWPFLRIR